MNPTSKRKPTKPPKTCAKTAYRVLRKVTSEPRNPGPGLSYETLRAAERSSARCCTWSRLAMPVAVNRLSVGCRESFVSSWHWCHGCQSLLPKPSCLRLRPFADKADLRNRVNGAVGAPHDFVGHKLVAQFEFTQLAAAISSHSARATRSTRASCLHCTSRCHGRRGMATSRTPAKSRKRKRSDGVDALALLTAPRTDLCRAVAGQVHM